MSSRNTDSDSKQYGDYFEADEKIHRLKLYEGDTLLESRFGQSMDLVDTTMMTILSHQQ